MYILFPALDVDFCIFIQTNTLTSFYFFEYFPVKTQANTHTHAAY